MSDMLVEFNELIATGDEEAVKKHIGEMRVLPECGQSLSSWSVPVSVAAVNGRVNILNILLEEGFHPHKDRHPIHFACIMGHLNIVKYMIEDHHFNIMCRDFKGQTPLYLAVFNDKFDIVKYLIQAGADVNNAGRMPPLVIAVIHYKPELCKYLIEHGANVNVHDNFGRTPLGAAARSDSKNIVCMLLEAGAHVNIATREGTPFLAASKAGRLSMMMFLHSRGAYVHVCDDDKDTALHLAVSEGHYKVARYLVVDLNVSLDSVNRDAQTAFQMALENRDVDIMGLMYRCGYNPARELSIYKEFSYFHLSSPEKDMYFQCISDFTNCPYSLQELACFSFRKTLRSPLKPNVDNLPVPQIIKEQLLLRHIPQTRQKKTK